MSLSRLFNLDAGKTMLTSQVCPMKARENNHNVFRLSATLNLHLSTGCVGTLSPLGGGTPTKMFYLEPPSALTKLGGPHSTVSRFFYPGMALTVICCFSTRQHYPVFHEVDSGHSVANDKTTQKGRGLVSPILAAAMMSSTWYTMQGTAPGIWICPIE